MFGVKRAGVLGPASTGPDIWKYVLKAVDHSFEGSTAFLLWGRGSRQFWEPRGFQLRPCLNVRPDPALCTASSMASKAVDQTILLNKVAAGSYRNTIVGDETYLSLGLEPSSQKVLANIAARNKGSASSNFSELGRREALVKEAIAANQSPWPLGYAPVARPLGVGEQFNMVVDANQAKGLRGPGGFANFSNIPNQNYVRETLAITEQFKQDVSFVQRFEVVQPFTAKTGPIGPQIDGVTGRLLEGSKLHCSSICNFPGIDAFCILGQSALQFQLSRGDNDGWHQQCSANQLVGVGQ